MNVDTWTLSLTALGIMTLCIKGLYATLSKTMLCHCAECHILCTGMRNVVTLSFILLNVILLNVLILSVVMLSVVAPECLLSIMKYNGGKY